jgi:hypothetical protein
VGHALIAVRKDVDAAGNHAPLDALDDAVVNSLLLLGIGETVSIRQLLQGNIAHQGLVWPVVDHRRHDETPG